MKDFGHVAGDLLEPGGRSEAEQTVDTRSSALARHLAFDLCHHTPLAEAKGASFSLGEDWTIDATGHARRVDEEQFLFYPHAANRHRDHVPPVTLRTIPLLCSGWRRNSRVSRGRSRHGSGAHGRWLWSSRGVTAMIHAGGRSGPSWSARARSSGGEAAKPAGRPRGRTGRSAKCAVRKTVGGTEVAASVLDDPGLSRYSERVRLALIG
jgi:hypothetical protein